MLLQDDTCVKLKKRLLLFVWCHKKTMSNHAGNKTFEICGNPNKLCLKLNTNIHIRFGCVYNIARF